MVTSHGGFDRNTGEGLIVLADREGQAVHFHATRPESECLARRMSVFKARRERG
jgi:hypothetical protein